ncbi:hypothetical protein DDI_3713 [Dickeya dianthicola RNS04.9]|nr:hypothetical protein DDI_3713 [Dickeya dianthicola RNS04.9]
MSPGRHVPGRTLQHHPQPQLTQVGAGLLLGNRWLGNRWFGNRWLGNRFFTHLHTPYSDMWRKETRLRHG